MYNKCQMVKAAQSQQNKPCCKEKLIFVQFITPSAAAVIIMHKY